MRLLRLVFPPLIVWVLGGGLFWMLQSQREAPQTEADTAAAFDPKPESTEPQQTAFILPKTQIYADQLRQVAERPLFSETRRIPEPEFIEDPAEVMDPEPTFEEKIIIEELPAPPDPPALVFKGFVRNGDEIQVLLGLPEHSEEQWVSKGDVLFEWRVQEVSEISIRLERDGFEHIVEASQ